MDRVDEVRRTRIEGATEDSPPTGRTVISRRAALGGVAAGAASSGERSPGPQPAIRTMTASSKPIRFIAIPSRVTR